MNRLKEKLRNGKRLIGTHVWLKDPCVCDMLGQLGFDFIWVDCEHSYLALDDVLTHLIAAGDTPVIVRLPQHDFNFTKKVLEMGPDGVIFPMVHSPEEAMELMRYTLYPPRGCRGFGPMRAVRYGIDDSLSYVDDDPNTLCRFIQIERASMAQAVPELLENPYIDGYIFGPNDLSASLGQTGRGMTEEAQRLIRQATEQLRAAGKHVGVSLGGTDQALLNHYADMGMNILSVGTDFSYILDGAKEALRRVQQAYNREENTK